MAERRMLSKSVIQSDVFLEMPLSSQALYMHLNVCADDDGFVSNPKTILRMTGAGEDDLKLLIAKGFVIVFKTGIIVITHWKRNNYIQKDRYKETIYKDEKAYLKITNTNTYEKTENICIQKRICASNTPGSPFSSCSASAPSAGLTTTANSSSKTHKACAVDRKSVV